MSSPEKMVLIVDDNALNRDLLGKTLRRGRYATVEAEDGVEALSVLKDRPVDIIVCDVLMPNMDGYSLCREVRRRAELQNLSFILYTATHFTPDDEKFGLQCGADRFVNKEGTPKVILKVIEEVLDERRDQRPPGGEGGVTDTAASTMEMKQYNSVMIRQLEKSSIDIAFARDELRSLNNGLEQRVGERTAQLAIANQNLERLNNELEERVISRTNELAAKNVILELRTLELARSNADLEQFASAASHDLQEPLRAVSGCIQIFERKYRGKIDDKSDELIQMIVSGSGRMKALIDGILAYSRAGRVESLETISAAAVLKNVLTDLKVAISESETEVVFEALPSLQFVRSQFEQVIRNLISNAVKYRSTTGQRVYVRAERQADTWIFSVADNGIGFEQQYAEKVFGVFQRLHTRDQYLGTGIGLAIAKKNIERRGGKIWVKSAPNEGATFFFSVPDAVNLSETVSK